MARESLYLIDGHAQIYRAYYAPFGRLTSPSGEPTRAVHVFVQMVLNLLRDREPDYLAMVMDVSDATVFRVEIDPAYKATRDKAPEDLAPQIDRIVSILEAMKVPILRKEGFEADDIMATLCKRFAQRDMDIYLVSRDKDLDQLLGDRVYMYDPNKERVIDVPTMIEEKGYGPDLAVEAQMLMGDSTDNIKGVAGVGPKKAAQLLQKYGSVDAIIEHADELTPKQRENVLAFRERKGTIRRLVTLRDDVPVDFFDLEAAGIDRFDPSAALPILTELGLNRLIERVASDENPGTANAGAAAVQAAEATLFDNAGTLDSRYELIDTDEKLAAFARKLAEVSAFAFDTETTGLVPVAADLVGISIAHESQPGCYIPLRGPGQVVSAAAVRRHLGPVFADQGIRKFAQNLKYDLIVLRAFGIEVACADFDTMIASFVLDSSRRSHGMDALSRELLNYKPIPISDLIGKGRKQITFDQVPLDRACDYAAEDADVTWRLHGVLEKQMSEPELQTLFHELEMPLVEVLAEMEYRGVAVDTDLLGRLSNEMADRLVELEQAIYEAAGRPFNINSTRQLGEVLFDERGLRVVKRTRTARSTDSEVLAALAAETHDPIPRLVIEHRELSKLKGTYVDALPELVCERTGRIHPSYHQTAAVTGRLSCSDPNLQNIPIRTEVGARIRRAFVPGQASHVLLKADYSQIELRVLAHFSEDDALRAAFEEDRDIHAFVAAQIARVPVEEVTKEQRARAKTVNFGIIYGQSAFGLARQTGMSIGDAKTFIARYFERYPKIEAFLARCVAHAKKHGYVKTILGRRRAIHDISSRNQSARNAAERLAVNTVIQGSAADLIKKAMIHLHGRIVQEKLPIEMLIQVHDELVFEAPTGEAKRYAKLVADEMSSALALEVPIRVDVGWGKNWLDLEASLD